MTQWNLTAPSTALQGVIRQQPEDFIVDEQMPVELSGEGEHLWLHLRKTGCNTEFVAKALARMAGLSNRDVGYAGQKDRHAVTTQWFSLHLPGQVLEDVEQRLPQGVQLLSCGRHSRKLKTGALSGNRFQITLRECQGDKTALAACIDTITQDGVPNYFGEQRFGRDGANIDKAKALFGGQIKVRDRHLRGLYLSAARSWLFNHVLSLRVADGSWNRILPGEVLALDGSRSFFVPEQIDETLFARLAAGDVHPSGPLWGKGESSARAQVAELEERVVASEPELAEGLVRAGLRQERRALRLRVPDLTHEWLEEDVLRVRFSLPPGTYATTVLRAFCRYQNISAAPALE